MCTCRCHVAATILGVLVSSVQLPSFLSCVQRKFLEKPAAGGQLGQSGSQNVLRILKSMAKEDREFPLEKIRRLVARDRASVTSRIRMELGPELAFAAEETSPSRVSAHERVLAWLGHRQHQRLRLEAARFGAEVAQQGHLCRFSRERRPTPQGQARWRKWTVLETRSGSKDHIIQQNIMNIILGVCF